MIENWPMYCSTYSGVNANHIAAPTIAHAPFPPTLHVKYAHTTSSNSFNATSPQ